MKEHAIVARGICYTNFSNLHLSNQDASFTVIGGSCTTSFLFLLVPFRTGVVKHSLSKQSSVSMTQCDANEEMRGTQAVQYNAVKLII